MAWPLRDWYARHRSYNLTRRICDESAIQWKYATWIQCRYYACQMRPLRMDTNGSPSHWSLRSRKYSSSWLTYRYGAASMLSSWRVVKRQNMPQGRIEAACIEGNMFGPLPPIHNVDWGTDLRRCSRFALAIAFMNRIRRMTPPFLVVVASNWQTQIEHVGR